MAAKIHRKKSIPYKFGEKHINYIRRCETCLYNIAEGAVRAGKTVDNVVAFCHELCRTEDKLHLATASTAATAKLILGDCNGFGIEHYFRGQCKWGKFRGNEALIIKGQSTGYRERIIIFVGGGKADSYKNFRGTSIGMWIATEIDLHHENTINEALARQAAARHCKIFWDLNPGSPFAPIYTKFIDDFEKKYNDGKLKGGYNYQLFTIYDNINISDEQRERFVSRFTPGSAEHRRKVKGERCVAEGLIFQQFADKPERFIVDEKPKNVRFIDIGVDFGGNKSKTTFVATGIIGSFDRICTLADHKMQGGKGTIDPKRIERELMDFCSYIKAEYPNAPIKFIHCDNEAQTLINGIRIAFAKAKLTPSVCDCYKGKIESRIYCLNSLMTEGRYHVYKGCENVIASLQTQVWDSKEITRDVRLDDGTIDIDTADANEYSFCSWMTQLELRSKGG